MSDRIEVTDHALERARERLHWEGADLAERIRVDVRVALLLDRTTAVRPNWTRGNNFDGVAPTGGRLYAWDKDATRCWVLVAYPGSTIYVRSVLSASDVAHLAGEIHHVRRGMRPK